MGKRGPKPGFNPKRRISETWSSNLAYAVGLLATDGCLSPPFSLIDLTSKDTEQLENFRRCLGVELKITKKPNKSDKNTTYTLFHPFYYYYYFNK